MPVIALYNFNDAGTVAADDATGNGAQDGSYTDGAASVGGRAVLDGINDKAKMTAEEFQMSKGTLEIQFSVDALKDDTQTVLSRDSTGQTAGGYRIDCIHKLTCTRPTVAWCRNWLRVITFVA